MKKQNKAQILREIAEKHDGVLTPEIVVAEASDKKHPLHSTFEWDTKKAAHQWRLQQAAMMIRSVRVRIQQGDTYSAPVRAYINVREEAEESEEEATTPSKGIYVPFQTAASVPSYKEQMLRAAFRDLRAFQNKYRNLSELTDIITAIDEILIEQDQPELAHQ